MPRATVTVSPEKGKAITLEGDGRGNFSRGGFDAGRYKLAIQASGFAPFESTLDVGSSDLKIAVKLEVAQVETSVEVESKISRLANTDPAYVALRKGALADTYEVRDFKIVRENAVLTFNGRITFGEPVLGKVVYAVFEGEGSLGLSPITADEKRFVEDRAGQSPLTEDFKTAAFFFTDSFRDQVKKGGKPAPLSDSAANILKDFRSRLHSRPQPARSLAERLMTSNESSNVEAKLLAELYHTAPKHQSFRAFLRGNKRHDLRLILDTRGALPDFPSPEEVALVNVDPGGTHDGVLYMTHLYGELKAGKATQEENKRAFQAEHYDIETAIARGGRLTAVTEITIQARESGARVVFFDLLPNLRATRVTIADQELPFIQEGRNVDGAFAAILPKALAEGQSVKVKIEYGGNKVLEDAGGGSFAVGARTSWYPNINTFLDRATYHLTFRTPKGLNLVSVGDLKREWKDGEYVGSEWESKQKLAIAGFNYGLFKKKGVLDPETKYQVDVFATEEMPGAIRQFVNSAAMSPSAMAQNALVDTQNSIRLFNHWFGALAYGKISITQQPQFNFGQSWPTLVYLPVSAFLDSTQRYMLMGSNTFRFNDFIQEVTPHEVAHQWWGHEVGWASYRDQWLSEGFAEFSASLFLETFDKKGDKTREFWDRLRRQILDKNSFGFTANDAGPVTLGIRLDSEKHEAAYRRMVYPKGAYIVHMLRQLMYDPKTGDEDFIAMMKDFTSTYKDRNASTEGFMMIVQKHMKPVMNANGDGTIGWFFNQFVWGQEIPKYKITSDVKPENGEFVAKVQITQSGVSDSFVMPVPVYVEIDGRLIRAASLVIKGNSTSRAVAIRLPKKPSKVLVNARHDVLSYAE